MQRGLLVRSLNKFYAKNFDRKCHKTTELIKLWWEEKTKAKLTNEIMTDFGFMVFNNEDRPIVAGFLYPVAGCQMAMVGFPIANPLIFQEERREAIAFLVASVEDYAKKLKYDFLVSYAGNKGAIGIWNRENYTVLDKEVIQFGKRLA